MSTENIEPFPALSPSNTEQNPPTNLTPQDATQTHTGRTRASSAASNFSRRSREASGRLSHAFFASNPPLGMWQATAEVGAKIPTLPDIRSGSFAAEGWSHEGQMERRGTNPHEIHRQRKARTSSATTRTRGSTKTTATPGTVSEVVEYFPATEFQGTQADTARRPTIIQESSHHDVDEVKAHDGEQTQKPPVVSDVDGSPSSSSSAKEPYVIGPDETGAYPNGYRFPKKHTWSQSMSIGLKAFWKFALTPFGFLITIYGLNVVAWGAMIFFVLLNAAPAMCHPSCNADNSARKKWIEIDSQILNALFCVTGFGLAPWRFRDFYYLMRWRVRGEYDYFRRLAGLNRGWFRLPGSDKLADDIGPPPVYSKKNPQTPESPPPYSAEEIAAMEANPAIPIPATSMPPAPLTGVRAPPTKPYNIDIVVWMYLWNTILQGALAGCMWGLNRFNRPSATTGIFITFGCLVAIAAGIVVFIEGKKIKAVEGIPVHEYDVFETVEEHMAKKEEEAAKKEKKAEKHRRKHPEEATVESENEKAALGHSGPATDGGRPTMTRTHTRTEKVKGKHWFERH